MSTEDAILKLCSNLYNGINQNESTLALFVDMTKAFDMVDHNILLNKLQSIGFRGAIFNWLQSYLREREQKVIVNGCYSNPCYLKNGVPQGSVLGPLFFLVYINSIFNLKLNGLSTAFADDIAFTYTYRTTFDCVIKIEEDLEALRSWFTSHKLIISDKTKLMSFKLSGNDLLNLNLHFHAHNCKKFSLPIHTCGKNNYNTETQCSLNCVKIEPVKEFKYLGVYIDSNLNWVKHTSELRSHMMLVARKMYLIKPFCSRKVLTLIYNGLAQSMIQYGITTWGGCYSSNLKPLLTAQKHLIRIICNKNRFTESLPLFTELKILPMRHLYVFKVLKEFYKQSGNIPSRCSQLYGLRINNLHFVNEPFTRKKHFSHFFTITAP